MLCTFFLWNLSVGYQRTTLFEETIFNCLKQHTGLAETQQAIISLVVSFIKFSAH